MGYLKYKGYSGSVEYSEADDCLFGKVQGMDKDCISYEGETLSGLRHDFEEAVDAYLESCKERGVIPRRPFSGRLVLRMSSELHGRVAFAAAGTRKNQLFLQFGFAQNVTELEEPYRCFSDTLELVGVESKAWSFATTLSARDDFADVRARGL